MAQQVSENIRKCKLYNEREAQRLQRHIDSIKLRESTSLIELDRQRIRLMQELHISRCRELHKCIQRALNINDDLNVLKQDNLVFPVIKKRPDVYDRSRGFTKIEIDDDDDDNYLYHGMPRNKTAPNLRTTSESFSRELIESDIYLHYPTEENLKINGGIITLQMLNQQKLQAEYNQSSLSDKDLVTPFPYNFSAKKMPKYVSKLKTLAYQTFDQFTDGAMHLEERLLVQRQREHMPLPPGYLPVRKRKPKKQYGDRNHDYTQCTNQTYKEIQLRFPKINKNTAPPKNIKVFIPKAQQSEIRLKEDSEEQSRVYKLKHAHEVEHYTAAIEKTATFLGKRSVSAKLVPSKTLSGEEIAMLQHLKKSPSFQTQSSVFTN